jgi:hypothetical protein
VSVAGEWIEPDRAPRATPHGGAGALARTSASVAVAEVVVDVGDVFA